MSQIDKIHFLPTLVWVFICYLLWYIFILLFFVPKYYKVLRSRYFLEVFLLEEINRILISIELKRKYFFLWKKLILNNIFVKLYLHNLKKKLDILRII